MILVFGGTTEGKEVAAQLEILGKEYLYSTKNKVKSAVRKYGVQLNGGLDELQLITLCRKKSIGLIIDAAHPFASQLHNTVLRVSEKLDIQLLRYERKQNKRICDPLVHYVTDFPDALQVLAEMGNPSLLALSGVKSIARLVSYWKNTETWFRIMDRKESIALAKQSHFPLEKLILGYPSDDVTNEQSLYKNLKVRAILTKESGDNGKQSIKIKAAQALNIPILIIQKPILPQYDDVIYNTASLKDQLFKSYAL